jgi:hypothetical protein
MEAVAGASLTVLAILAVLAILGWLYLRRCAESAESAEEADTTEAAVNAKDTRPPLLRKQTLNRPRPRKQQRDKAADTPPPHTGLLRSLSSARFTPSAPPPEVATPLPSEPQRRSLFGFLSPQPAADQPARELV